MFAKTYGRPQTDDESCKSKTAVVATFLVQFVIGRDTHAGGAKIVFCCDSLARNMDFALHLVKS